jgi:hypothetical protein
MRHEVAIDWPVRRARERDRVNARKAQSRKAGKREQADLGAVQQATQNVTRCLRLRLEDNAVDDSTVRMKLNSLDV